MNIIKEEKESKNPIWLKSISLGRCFKLIDCCNTEHLIYQVIDLPKPCPGSKTIKCFDLTNEKIVLLDEKSLVSRVKITEMKYKEL